MRRADRELRGCGGSALTLPTLIFRYALFAVLATIANLGVQRLVLTLGHSAVAYAAAVLAGTLVGLALKYVLDKRWIFSDRSTGLREHGTKFTLYTAMGIVTTAIFWATETAFWLAGQTQAWREAGAVLGLSIGYVVKYQLDRRFVFRQSGLDGGAIR